MLVERGGAEPAAVVVFRVVVLTLTARSDQGAICVVSCGLVLL